MQISSHKSTRHVHFNLAHALYIKTFVKGMNMGKKFLGRGKIVHAKAEGRVWSGKIGSSLFI